ncbi:uncharacterized protein [Populus alba]|uniref:PGG domain-containing protein n=1 Tax=Populus alba TaxID=43335 RepID=A0A4U5NQT9_POPAL|nr:protein ACCELERATED CELL DEATH 6-like [Populus alba]TKR86037.1 hypothetical protein D5086_0000241920 [Populus alba]
MELSINIPGQSSNQRDKNFRKWKSQSFPSQIPRDDDPKKMMDKELYKYATEDKFDELFRELRRVSSAELSSIIYTQVSPSGNSLLHVSARHGSKDVTELLLQHFPLLMTRKNFHKDTALHLAAGAGRLETITVLVNKAKGHGGASDFSNFLEMKNDRGNTALHDAVIKRHHEVARFLVSESSKLLYTENNERKSPLYLAVVETSIDDKGSDEKMFTILMDAIPDDVDLLNKLEGKSPVHAAVLGREKTSMGYVEETQFLFDKYRDGAIQQNEEGNMPIHVASKKNHVDVVHAYISDWTDAAEFLNSKRQNILHVAAESGRHLVVKYILRNKNLEALINEQDLDGNTPLHLASKNGRSIATFTLVRNPIVKKRIRVANGENLTPYEVAEKQSKIVGAEYSGEPIPNGKDDQVDHKSENNGEKPQTKDKSDHGVGNQVDQDEKSGRKGKLDYYGVMMTLSILHFWAGPKRSIAEYLRIKGRPLPKEEIKGRIDTLLVVAVLIAGVTFSGILQLPRSADLPESGPSNITTTTTNSTQNQGISAQNEGILRNVYIYFDMVALNAAVMASIILCWAQLYDVKVAAHAVWLASILTGGAIYLMCLAFVFAVAINVGNSFAFIVVTLVVGGVLFLVQTVLSAPLIIPPNANQIIERIASPCLYFVFFICYYAFESLLSKFSKRSTN